MRGREATHIIVSLTVWLGMLVFLRFFFLLSFILLQLHFRSRSLTEISCKVSVHVVFFFWANTCSVLSISFIKIV